MNSDSNARFFGLLGLGIFAVWLTAGIGSGFYHCLASLRWPRTTSHVTMSQVNIGASNVGTWWAPEVQYEYAVGGKTYRATNIRYLMPHLYDESPAREMAAPYPVGRETSVAYDPQNPAESVLEPGIPAGMWKQALIPVFFWSLVAYIAYEINHPKRRILLRSNPQDEVDDLAKAA